MLREEAISINTLAGRMLVQFDRVYPSIERGPKMALLYQELQNIKKELSDYVLKQVENDRTGAYMQLFGRIVGNLDDIKDDILKELGLV